MAVVIHGSFDEGPITLALPDYFEGFSEEIDPIFLAWDKSTGISIPASQVSDFDTEVTNNATVTANTAKNTYPVADAVKLAAISGTNTGDDTGHNLLVPYAGATGNVDLGANDLSVNMITLGGTPSNPTDVPTKGYVDGIIATGIIWKTAVIDTVVNAAALPGGADLYDRYITIDDGHIRESDGAEGWSDTTPSTGWTLYIAENSLSPTNDVGIHTYNGSSWVYVGGSINHNDTGNIQGGAPGEYYHLAFANSTAANILTTTTADATPSNFAFSSSGITNGEGGAQSAYVVYTWDAIVTDTFDHYIFQYKQHAFTYWQSMITKDTTITVEGLLPNVSYDFRVASVNKYGAISAYTATDNRSTPSDDGVPADVTIGSATPGIQYVIVDWTHNTDLDLASYKVYRYVSDNVGSATEIGDCRTNYFIDGGLTGDQIYYYWVKAVDTSGNLSANFSSSVNATPRNVEDGDVTRISGDKILINGAVFLTNWAHTSDMTKIDGGDIYTSSVTATQLNFVPTDLTNVVATINASDEGITITGEHIQINGSTDFVPIEGDGGSRLFIYPDENTGIQITDDEANDVFNVQIGGTHVGDVRIGNYNAGQGVWYDKSTGTTFFAGNIVATAGTIGLWSIDTDAVYTGIKNTTNGYSTSGITLSGDGSIHATKFYIDADGTAMIAAIDLTHTVVKKPGDVARNQHNAEAHTGFNDAPILLKTITLTNGLLGTQRFKFQMKISPGGAGHVVDGVIKRNGVVLGTPRQTDQTSYQDYSQDITQAWEPGDTCELWATSNNALESVYVRNFSIGYDDNPNVGVASENS